MSARDRVGLGWRAPLAASILARLDRIDVVEVLAEEWTREPAWRQRALATLGAQAPVLLHATSLSLASSWPVDEKRLSALGRLVERARPESWSEHLAFVRAAGVETGHLAAPPRTRATIEGVAANVARASRVVGAAPALENVATLLAPPCSEMGELEWLRGALEASGAGFLLDLHNLHANAVNHGFDAGAALAALPLERVACVHVAGGRWADGRDGRRRLVDDHLHPTPDPVLLLLEELASRCAQPLTVILERDGRYPPFAELLAELERAREALARGRARREAAA